MQAALLSLLASMKIHRTVEGTFQALTLASLLLEMTRRLLGSGIDRVQTHSGTHNADSVNYTASGPRMVLAGAIGLSHVGFSDCVYITGSGISRFSARNQ